MPKPSVLVVDDEPDLTELVTLTLERMKVDAAVAANVEQAVAQFGQRHFDLCLTDMRLPDGDGLDLVEWIQAHHPQTPVAVITAHGNVELAVRALKLGAFDFVSKPLDVGVLRKLVTSAVKLSGSGENTGSFIRGPQLIGHSKSMQDLRALIARVSRSQAPVHISGESGTGKELVARLIHQSGSRADAPFVAVNCGAIPSELMESELFGHRRGSFTGAVSDKPGLIHAAEGGTLFLDEVADLPLHMQVKLLRVIQEKAVRPIGAQREEPIDVRILSATHRHLAQWVASGKFREDLFYRINVIEIRVPALREHRDDLDALIDDILRRMTRKITGVAPTLGAAARRALHAHPFPGNVRELENVLERALALNSGPEIGVDELQLRSATMAPPLEPDALLTPGAATHVAPSQDDATGEGLDEQLAHVERDAIVKALEQTRYNKTAAAKLLGVSFRALRYKVKKLGIE